jgi:hypothetical protein
MNIDEVIKNISNEVLQEFNEKNISFDNDTLKRKIDEKMSLFFAKENSIKNEYSSTNNEESNEQNTANNNIEEISRNELLGFDDDEFDDDESNDTNMSEQDDSFIKDMDGFGEFIDDRFENEVKSEKQDIDNTDDDDGEFIQSFKVLYKREMTGTSKSLVTCLNILKTDGSLFERLFMFILLCVPALIGIIATLIYIIILSILAFFHVLFSLLLKAITPAHDFMRLKFRTWWAAVKRNAGSGNFFKILFSIAMFSVVLINGMMYVCIKGVMIPLKSIHDINKILANLSAKAIDVFRKTLRAPAEMTTKKFNNLSNGLTNDLTNGLKSKSKTKSAEKAAIAKNKKLNAKVLGRMKNSREGRAKIERVNSGAARGVARGGGAGANVGGMGLAGQNAGGKATNYQGETFKKNSAEVSQKLSPQILTTTQATQTASGTQTANSASLNGINKDAIANSIMSSVISNMVKNISADTISNSKTNSRPSSSSNSGSSSSSSSGGGSSSGGEPSNTKGIGAEVDTSSIDKLLAGMIDANPEKENGVPKNENNENLSSLFNNNPETQNANTTALDTYVAEHNNENENHERIAKQDLETIGIPKSELQDILDPKDQNHLNDQIKQNIENGHFTEENASEVAAILAREENGDNDAKIADGLKKWGEENPGLKDNDQAILTKRENIANDLYYEEKEQFIDRYGMSPGSAIVAKQEEMQQELGRSVSPEETFPDIAKDLANQMAEKNGLTDDERLAQQIMIEKDLREHNEAWRTRQECRQELMENTPESDKAKVTEAVRNDDRGRNREIHNLEENARRENHQDTNNHFQNQLKTNTHQNTDVGRTLNA